MQAAAHNPAFSAAREERASRFFTVQLLRTLAACLNDYPWLSFAAISLLGGCIRLWSFPSHFLSHDELFSYYIAEANSLSELVRLTHTVDLHPPLSYLLIRASFAVFGRSIWACRLPSVLCFLAATGLVFWLARRLTTPVFAAVALLTLWSAPITYRVAEARPYSALLCFTTLLVASWYSCVAEENAESPARSAIRGWRPALVATAALAVLLSHVLGVLSLAVVMAAEAVRFVVRKKADWSLWAALVLPLAAVASYLPLFHTSSGLLFASQYRASPSRLLAFYWDFIHCVPLPLAVIVLASLFWPTQNESIAAHGQPDSARTFALVWPLRSLLAGFALVPLLIGAAFANKGVAFFDRYGIAFLIPFSLAPAMLAARRTRANRMAGTVFALILTVVFILNTVAKSWLIEELSEYVPPKAAGKLLAVLTLPFIVAPSNPLVPSRLGAQLADARVVSDIDSLEPALPIVANTGLTFLELDFQGSEPLVRRLYLLEDRQAAVTIAHDTVFENYNRLKEVFPIRGSIEPYCEFVRRHPRFLVFGTFNHPQGWVLKRLEGQGSDLRILGTYNNTTEGSQVYQATVSANQSLECAAVAPD